MFNRIDEYFSGKRRGIAALCAVGFALLWMLLWDIFPMEFYSLFFMSVIGGNIQLLLLDIVTLLPFLWVFTKLTGTPLSFSKIMLANLILLFGANYVFSLFFFTNMRYLCLIPFGVQTGANVWLFRSAAETVNAKQKKAEKKQPVLSAVWAAAFSFVTEAASCALLYIIAHIYAY